MTPYRTGGEHEPLCGSGEIESGRCCALGSVPCRSSFLQATESLCSRREAGPSAALVVSACPSPHGSRIGRWAECAGTTSRAAERDGSRLVLVLQCACFQVSG